MHTQKWFTITFSDIGLASRSPDVDKAPRLERMSLTVELILQSDPLIPLCGIPPYPVHQHNQTEQNGCHSIDDISKQKTSYIVIQRQLQFVPSKVSVISGLVSNRWQAITYTSPAMNELTVCHLTMTQLHMRNKPHVISLLARWYYV